MAKASPWLEHVGMLKTLSLLPLIALLATAASTAHAASSKWNTTSKNVAVGGYDLVAYHTEAAAKKGSPKYQATYDGVRFYFSSQTNQARFKATPKKYLPKYNGWCAFAVAMKNAKVPADPKTFKFHNGQLLFFFNDLYQGKKFNTKVPWNQNEPTLKTKADQNWPKLAQQ